ncbi:ABC transporter permease [Lutimonas zeaxanthinifaciens]|uniref:ABC transporter permease n=1 Tax=Lutimonas zeaxanthinifaciens TaxID=3060215 RepID=UPI00265D3125|nr:ABC transporter permease subunit [Lutimonas sp. YSD2104]WKK65170.1 ABC transporter permease subunit [Lutimonas sp. YSD2104]
MLRLLSIEIHKLKNSRASKILIIVYFALLTSIALIAAIKFDIGPIQFHLAEQGIFNFPYIWHFNTFIAAFFKFFLLLVIVSMMANEYSNKTLKQNLIDGLSKKEFVLSKFYTVVLFALVSTIFVFGVSMVLGLIYSDYNEISIIFSDLEYLIAFFVKLTGFFSFGLFLGVLIKRSAFAVGAMLVWFFAETIGYNIFKWNLFKGTDVADYVFQFAPLKAMWNLIDEPFSRLNAVKTLANQIGEDISSDFGIHLYEIAIVIGWTAIFIYGSYYLLKIRDL